jgi:thiol-disulfide isomerase/thioredoxin
MNRTLSIFGLMFLLLGVAAAVQSPSSAQKQSPPPKKNDVAPPADPVLIDAAGYTALLSRHRGKPVMVNFWATWCPPCREEFPMVSELAQKYSPQGLVVLGVSFDDDGEIVLVRRFLARVKPVFPNYRKKPGPDGPIVRAADPKWSGALPATLFYDPQGRVVTRLVGDHKRADFEAAIENLLKRPSPSPAPPVTR